MSGVCSRQRSRAFDVRAALEQQIRGGHVAAAGDDHERRLAVGAGRLDVGARVEQLPDDLRVADRRGLGHR